MINNDENVTYRDRTNNQGVDRTKRKRLTLDNNEMEELKRRIRESRQKFENYSKLPTKNEKSPTKNEKSPTENEKWPTKKGRYEKHSHGSTSVSKWDTNRTETNSAEEIKYSRSENISGTEIRIVYARSVEVETTNTETVESLAVNVEPAVMIEAADKTKQKIVVNESISSEPDSQNITITLPQVEGNSKPDFKQTNDKEILTETNNEESKFVRSRSVKDIKHFFEKNATQTQVTSSKISDELKEIRRRNSRTNIIEMFQNQIVTTNTSPKTKSPDNKTNSVKSVETNMSVKPVETISSIPPVTTSVKSVQTSEPVKPVETTASVKPAETTTTVKPVETTGGTTNEDNESNSVLKSPSESNEILTKGQTSVKDIKSWFERKEQEEVFKSQDERKIIRKFERSFIAQLFQHAIGTGMNVLTNKVPEEEKKKNETVINKIVRPGRTVVASEKKSLVENIMNKPRPQTMTRIVELDQADVEMLEQSVVEIKTSLAGHDERLFQIESKVSDNKSGSLSTSSVSQEIIPYPKSRALQAQNAPKKESQSNGPQVTKVKPIRRLNSEQNVEKDRLAEVENKTTKPQDDVMKTRTDALVEKLISGEQITLQMNSEHTKRGTKPLKSDLTRQNSQTLFESLVVLMRENQ